MARRALGSGASRAELMARGQFSSGLRGVELATRRNVLELPRRAAREARDVLISVRAPAKKRYE